MEREIIDPKLRQALDQMGAILEQHQIGGVLIVASSTHAAFRVHFPEWCGVQITPEGARIKLSSKDNARSEASLHVLFSMRDLAELQGQQLGFLANKVIKELESQGAVVEHNPFGGDGSDETKQ